MVFRANQGPVTYVGAVASSHIGDPEFVDFQDAVMVARYGETPSNLELGG